MQQYRWYIVNCRCWLLTTVSTCFGHLYAHRQEKRPRVTAYGVYLLVVLDVAGFGTVVLRWGCEHCEGCCSSSNLYCCILLVFFLHALLTMHGHRDIKINTYLCGGMCSIPVSSTSFYLLDCLHKYMKNTPYKTASKNGHPEYEQMMVETRRRHQELN